MTSSGGLLRRGADISERLLLVAVGVVRISKRLARDPTTRHIAMQMLRSGTSAGANYEEARGAESRADFVHKVRVSTKELRETLYWLKLIGRAELVPQDESALIDEVDQMIAILMASARTARQRPPVPAEP